MSIFTLFMLFATTLLIYMLIPDILPRCSCCGKLKLRTFFRVHKTTGLKPGYSSNKSICKKCCRKYEIDDLDGYYRFDHIRRKVVIDLDKVRASKELLSPRGTRMKRGRSSHS